MLDLRSRTMTEGTEQATAGATGDGDRTPRESSEALAYSAAQLARRLYVSLRHLRRLDCTGRVPRPIRLGRSVRWPAAEIDGWLAAGAPDRERWERLRTTRDGRARP